MIKNIYKIVYNVYRLWCRDNFYLMLISVFDEIKRKDLGDKLVAGIKNKNRLLVDKITKHRSELTPKYKGMLVWVNKNGVLVGS